MDKRSSSELRVPRLVTKCHSFSGTSKFIVVFTTAMPLFAITSQKNTVHALQFYLPRIRFITILLSTPSFFKNKLFRNFGDELVKILFRILTSDLDTE